MLQESEPPHQTSVLDGIRVLDVTKFYSGPFSTLLLAGLGAEIIRIDEPSTGDPVAEAPPFIGRDGAGFTKKREDDLGIAYLKRARSKKSVTLNLKTEAGKDLFYRLVKDADVLVENFSVGVTERLGIDYPTLKALNPRLVYCSITGYGATGPDRHLKAYDTMVQAAAGLMSITGHADGPPTKAGSALSDGLAGVYAAFGAVSALCNRAKTGQGQFVDVSMVDCLLSLVLDEPLDIYEQLGLPFRQGNRIMRFSPFNSYQCADGWIVVGVATGADWSNLLKAIDRADLLADERFSEIGWRLENNGAVDTIVADWCAGRSSTEIVARLTEFKIACGPVRDIADLKAWPQLKARGMLEPLCHPVHGPLQDASAAGFPLKFSRSASGYQSPAPLVGEHNDAVFGGMLNLSAGEIQRLQEAGVI